MTHQLSSKIHRDCCPPSPPPGHTQQLTSLLQCHAPKRFFETRTNRKEQVADMWWMDYQNVHKKRCSYSGCVWGKGATGPEDWTAAPFGPPGLLLLPCINSRCSPKKPAIQLEPHIKWLSYDFVPRLAHHITIISPPPPFGVVPALHHMHPSWSTGSTISRDVVQQHAQTGTAPPRTSKHNPN